MDNQKSKPTNIQEILDSLNKIEDACKRLETVYLKKVAKKSSASTVDSKQNAVH